MSITLSRKELYDRVWAEPIQKLSKELGLSDVGLAKVCRRNAIPVPPRGYWARKQAGQKIAQAALPKPPEGTGGSIEFLRRPPAPAPAAAAQESLDPRVAAELDPDNAIVVPDQLRITHPLLRNTKEYWRITSRSSHTWGTPLPSPLRIDVASTLRVRTLRIAQALFSALEKRGYKIARGDGGEIKVKVLDEDCTLVIRERLRQVSTERRRLGDSSLFPNKQPRDLVATGELIVAVDRGYSKQTQFGDGPSSRTEDELNQVVAALISAALAEKERRAARKRQEEAAREREREQARRQQLALEERAKVQRLNGLMQATEYHNRLIAFRSALRQTLGPSERPELAEWLTWLDEHADESDALLPFRSPQAELTLYHCVSSYAVNHLLARGFENEPPPYSREKNEPACVTLTDVPMEGVHGGTTCVLIDVPEDAVLPYESIDRNRQYREFKMPASVANRFIRRVDSE